MARIVLSGLLALLLASCASAPPAETPAPLPQVSLGPEGSETIGVGRVIIRIPSGSTIGHFYPKKKDKYAQPLMWGTGNVSIADLEFRLQVLDELQRFGFSVLGSSEILFGESPSYRPRFLLGAIINHLKFDTYGPRAGNYSSATITVEWVLYDTELQQTVYRTTSQGFARKAGDLSLSVVFLAFNASLEKVLTNEAFLRFVRKSSATSDSQLTGDAREKAFLLLRPCRPSQLVSLPKDIEAVERSVLVIQSTHGLGAGVIISEDGFVLTAAHIVAGVKTATAKFKNGLVLEAAVFRVHEQTDSAILKLPGAGHQCLPIWIEPNAFVGRDVFAIGHPRALEFSVAKGIVSGVRDDEGGQIIQTDAALNPGHSGGPLLTESGHVLGIVTHKTVVPATEGLAFVRSVRSALEGLRVKLEKGD